MTGYAVTGDSTLCLGLQPGWSRADGYFPAEPILSDTV